MDMVMTARRAAADAEDKAFDAVLGDDYGNFMEYKMVVEEMAYGGDVQAQAELTEMEDRLTAARKAGDLARAAFIASQA